MVLLGGMLGFGRGEVVVEVYCGAGFLLEPAEIDSATGFDQLCWSSVGSIAGSDPGAQAVPTAHRASAAARPLESL